MIDGDPDPAPRTAYELTACVASGDRAGVDRLWESLDGPARAGVVAALGAQARQAAWTAGEAGAALFAAQVIDVITDLRHCGARQAVVEALGACPIGLLPGCDGCPAPAVALAWARLRVLQALGFPANHVAEICRRTAAR